MIALYAQKEEKDKLLQNIEEKIKYIKNLSRKVEESIREERKNREDIEKVREGLKEKLIEIKIEINRIEDRLRNEFLIEFNTLDVKELFPDDKFPSTDWLEKRMVDFREKLSNFGEVNPMAVEDYKEQKERYDFIISQKNDILKAKDDLMETISKIDEQAKEEFLAAFVQIRENFIKVFRSLFTDQDNCDLVLTNPENPTESTIDIIAKPKGKRPLTINQLSGGEKTLTATSLLFAIYLLKPAPFCIFDEVDAPLDDANIDKFNNIIIDFSNESQFIIVTHNKRTMTTTNVIYGVTMEETGISRVLPVDLGVLNLN